MNVDVVMNSAPVIPVLVLDGSVDPVALAETLVEAGLPVIEVTLRTASALDAIRAMSGLPERSSERARCSMTGCLARRLMQDQNSLFPLDLRRI
jgi:hypothetical protein